MSTEERLENMEEKMDKIEDRLDAIHNALLGNEYNEAGGFIQRLSDMEKRLRIIEKYIDRWKWFLIGLSIAAGIGTSSVLSALASFISKFAQ